MGHPPTGRHDSKSCAKRVVRTADALPPANDDAMTTGNGQFGNRRPAATVDSAAFGLRRSQQQPSAGPHRARRVIAGLGRRSFFPGRPIDRQT
jgi:hypothetical protein